MDLKKINRERVLLTILVGVAFIGFLLWEVQQYQNDEENLALADTTVNTETGLKNKMIAVSGPKANSTISSPVSVSGSTQGEVKIRIKDSNNMVLGEVSVNSTDASKMSAFSANVKYKKATQTKGSVEIFKLNKTTNIENYKIIIPVVFGK